MSRILEEKQTSAQYNVTNLKVIELTYIKLTFNTVGVSLISTYLGLLPLCVMKPISVFGHYL